MKKQTASNIKLGLFVTAGIAFLIITLYMIGKNRNIFGGNYKIKARFHNIQGLQNGNNVRYAGMDVGTVNEINMINDTVIEVELLINNRMKQVIRKNAVAFIVTDGLVGDKVLNITPGDGLSDFATENDMIVSRRTFETEDMISKLEKTNENVSVISDSVLSFMRGIQDPKGVGGIIRNQKIAGDIQSGIHDLQIMSENLKKTSYHFSQMINEIKKGEHGIGKFIMHSDISEKTDSLYEAFNNVSENLNEGITQLRDNLDSINRKIQYGSGTVAMLLNNEEAEATIREILANVEKGTDNFNQNMEALQHNIFFRGYFKKKRYNK